MAGHSKWANIQHRKGAQDKKRGKLFTKLIREITIAARAGGGDMAANARLRLAVDKAKSQSMPKDNIDRAIKRGAGELNGTDYQEIRYEGYGPGGTAVMVDCLTDNRNRTSGDVRSTLTKNGGSLAEPGAVAWQFERKGVILVPTSVDEDELMLAALDAGAEDIAEDGDMWRVTSAPSDLNAVRGALEAAEIGFESADLTMLPTSTVEVADPSSAKAVLRLMDVIDDLDDVQDVHANFDIADEVMDAVTSG